MPGSPRVGCFTFCGLTVAPTSGYTGYIGSRERIIPMDGGKAVAGEEGADARVVILDPEKRSRAAQTREVARVARAVAAGAAVDGVWPDTAWSGTFFASVRSRGGDS